MDKETQEVFESAIGFVIAFILVMLLLSVLIN